MKTLDEIALEVWLRCNGETNHSNKEKIKTFARRYRERLAQEGPGRFTPEHEADIEAAYAEETQVPEPVAFYKLPLEREAVSALAIHLFHRERPAFGWIENHLLAIENALKPIHNKIHDENFNAMYTAFFGYDRKLPNAAPVLAPGMVQVPEEIINRFPEINPSNYNHDDACALNAWGVEVVLAAAKEKAK